VILVTGAAGKTGRAVIVALSRRGQAVRALVRRPEQADSLRRLGAREVIVGDMRDHSVLMRALSGASSVYHICPNMSPDEIVIGRMALAAAREGGVGRFVYHSVLHPQTEAMPHHWNKMRVEELLFESGLPYTILQPAAYMQNVFAGWESIVSRGDYRIPYAPGTRLGMVDLEDVAEAAATILTEPGHEGATYELAGLDILSQDDVATILTRNLGREVRAEVVPLAVWEQEARAAGLGDYQIDTLRAMFRYYERHGFWGNPHVLAWLLGRPPASFDTFVARIVNSSQE
jgi:uncharacterized protein YbjT (DUF2867 family)